MRDEIIDQITSWPEDSSPPWEAASIHLKDFDVIFVKQGDQCEPVLVKNEESGVWLIKIYLIKKVQFEHVVSLQTGLKFKEKTDNQLEEGDMISISNSISIYNSIAKVAELDQLPIYIMTNSEAYSNPDKLCK